MKTLATDGESRHPEEAQRAASDLRGKSTRIAVPDVGGEFPRAQRVKFALPKIM